MQHLERVGIGGDQEVDLVPPTRQADRRPRAPREHRGEDRRHERTLSRPPGGAPPPRATVSLTTEAEEGATLGREARNLEPRSIPRQSAPAASPRAGVCPGCFGRAGGGSVERCRVTPRI